MIVTGYAQKTVNIIPAEIDLKILDEKINIVSNFNNMHYGSDFDGYVWESSNTNVAVIGDNTLNYAEVIARSAGEAVIRLNLTLNNEIVATALSNVTSAGYDLKMITPDVYIYSEISNTNKGHLAVQNNIPASEYDYYAWEVSNSSIYIASSAEQYCAVSASSNFTDILKVYYVIYKNNEVLCKVSANVHNSQIGGGLDPFTVRNTGRNTNFYAQVKFRRMDGKWDSYEWSVSDETLASVDQPSQTQALIKAKGKSGFVVVCYTLKLQGEVVYIINGPVFYK